MSLIEIEQLTKRFGTTTALNAVSLAVPSNSIFALLGANGAGKTTLLKTIVNILEPTSGKVKVLGTDSRSLKSKDFYKIGYVSENQVLPDWMSVTRFLAFCKSMYPHWDDHLCEKLIKQLEVPLNLPIRKLSRGAKMKVALISSLAYRPQVIILDEPFSGLDALVREEFISGLLEVTNMENWSFLLSTHDIYEVERLADRIGMLDRGSLVLNTTIEAIQSQYRKIEITTPLPHNFSRVPEVASWISFQHQDRFISFVEREYEGARTSAQIAEFFPPQSEVSISTLTLQQVFVELTKHLKKEQY